MWVYHQKTGQLFSPGGSLCTIGYSGHAEGKNCPAMQNHPALGPLPRGAYTFEAPIDTATHGPYVLRLIPSSTNEMFGRSGFLMHGDSIVHPGTASLGCIIMPHWVRLMVWESGDRDLEVVE